MPISRPRRPSSTRSAASLICRFDAGPTRRDAARRLGPDDGLLCPPQADVRPTHNAAIANGLSAVKAVRYALTSELVT
jgi:hypothetical protein